MNPLNMDMVNRLKSFFRIRSGWHTFTPVLYQNGNITATITRARYYLDDNHATVSVLIQATAAGAAGNNIYMLLPSFLKPASAVASTMPLGVAEYYDTGTAVYHGNAVYVANVGGLPAIACLHTTDGNVVGANPNIAVANGDFISFCMVYEALGV